MNNCKIQDGRSSGRHETEKYGNKMKQCQYLLNHFEVSICVMDSDYKYVTKFYEFKGQKNTKYKII